MFDKKEMIDWENKPVVVKDNYNQAKLYFKNLVKDFEMYTQNSSGTAAKQGYESANMAADIGNKLRKYIQEITIAVAAEKELVANISKETKAKDAQILAMTTQIKTLSDTVATLMKSFGNKVNAPPNTGNKNLGSNPRQFNWTCNMEAYCWLHGHHPVSTKHTSRTCLKKKEGHINNAMAMDCKGGDKFWPTINKVQLTGTGVTS